MMNVGSTQCVQRARYIHSKHFIIIAVSSVQSALFQSLPCVKHLLFPLKGSSFGTLLKGQPTCRPSLTVQSSSYPFYVALCFSWCGSLPHAVLYISVFICLLSVSFYMNISPHDDSYSVGFITGFLVPRIVSAIWGYQVNMYWRHVSTRHLLGVGYDSIQWHGPRLDIGHRSCCISGTSPGFQSCQQSAREGLTHWGSELCSSEPYGSKVQSNHCARLEGDPPGSSFSSLRKLQPEVTMCEPLSVMSFPPSSLSLSLQDSLLDSVTSSRTKGVV